RSPRSIPRQRNKSVRRRFQAGEGARGSARGRLSGKHPGKTSVWNHNSGHCRLRQMKAALMIGRTRAFDYSGRGELTPCLAEGRDGEDDGIQLLEIPQLGEVKTDGRRLVQSACFDTLN